MMNIKVSITNGTLLVSLMLLSSIHLSNARCQSITASQIKLVSQSGIGISDSSAITSIKELSIEGKFVAMSDELGLFIDPLENNKYNLFPAYPDYKYGFFVQLPHGDYESYVLCEVPPAAKLVIAEKSSRTQPEINKIINYIQQHNQPKTFNPDKTRILGEVLGGAAGFGAGAVFLFYAGYGASTEAGLVLTGLSCLATSIPIYLMGTQGGEPGSFTYTLWGCVMAATAYHLIGNLVDWRNPPRGDEENYLSLYNSEGILFWALSGPMMVGSGVYSFNHSQRALKQEGQTALISFRNSSPSIQFPGITLRPGRAGIFDPTFNVQLLIISF